MLNHAENPGAFAPIRIGGVELSTTDSQALLAVVGELRALTTTVQAFLDGRRRICAPALMHHASTVLNEAEQLLFTASTPSEHEGSEVMRGA